MFQNKKFRFYAVTACLAGLAYMFVCAALDSGQMQIIRAVITPENGGWTAEQIRLPMTVGSFLAVPLAYFCCEGFLRAGVRQTLILCAAAAALGCIGLVCANGLDVYGGAAAGHYPLFFASLALICSACALVQLGVIALCLGWFVRFRGRVLGVVTLGAPLFAAVGAAAIANLVQTVLGGDYRPLYLGAAALLALLALVTRFLLRDRPEEAGLYPDGDGRPPAGEPAEEEPPLPLSRVLRDKRTWLVLLCLGALTATAAGCLTFLEPRLLARHGGGPALLNRAAPWLALGTIFAIPASYLFGWLCDRLGESWSGALLALAEGLTVFVLWRFPKDAAAGDMSVWLPLCLGLACIMGGVSTVTPSLLSRVFGRLQVLSAGRAVFPFLLLCSALTGPLGTLLGGGTRSRLYAVLGVLAGLGLLTSLATLVICPKKPLAKDRE